MKKTAIYRYGIGITPGFSIGQRALLVQTAHGNFLYDCVSYLDDEAVEKIRSLGGVQGICLSHPHFYDSMVSWSHAFNEAPIYVPVNDKSFVMRPDPVIRYWDGASPWSLRRASRSSSAAGTFQEARSSTGPMVQTAGGRCLSGTLSP